jgi:broad specificity phosphatase PhoE
MAPTWYIFRHALATYSKNGYGDQIISAPILPEARASIEAMAHYLNDITSSANYSSEYLRCRQTAEIISNVANKKFVFDDRINEFHDEPFEAFHERVHNWYSEVANAQPANIIVCSHGAVLSALRHIVIRGDFIEQGLLDYPPCGELMIIRDKEVQIIDFNPASVVDKIPPGPA